MNVIDLRIMLHHVNSEVMYVIKDGNSTHDTYKRLTDDDLLIQFAPYKYKLSERGRVFVDALTGLPLPVRAWTMPK